jgi:hypothetical protein
VARAAADDSGPRPAPRPGSSLSIEVGRPAARSQDVTPPQTPVPARSRRSRPPSDFDETLPIERIELSRRDIEILTPSPVLEPPAALPMPPRSSRVHDVPAPPPRVAAASGSPPPVAVPRDLDGLPALPDIAASRELEVMPGLRRTSARHEVPVPPAVSEFPGPPTEPAPTLAKPAGKPRPSRPTQKTRPEPRPGARIHAPRAPRRRRSLVWLILLMIALGSGAMAAAYYLPDL